MKVLFVTKGAYHPSGGAQSAAWDWYQRIAKRVNCKLLSNLDSQGINHTRPNIGKAPFMYLTDALWFSKKIAQECKTFRPDIVHLHSYTGFVSILPKTVPSVVTFHDEPLFTPFDNISNGLNPYLLRILSENEKILRRMMLLRNPWIQALSSTIKNQFTDIGISEDRIRVIPNGFPKETKSNDIISKENLMKELALPYDAKLVLTIGAISFRKGIHRILRTAAELREYNVHFVCAGSTSLHLEKGYSEKLRYLSSKHKISNLHLIGRVSSEILESLLHHADLYISPSLSEACNLSLMEAALHSLPIVTTDVGAARDLFEGHAKIVNRNPSTKSLVESVLELLEVPSVKYPSVGTYSWENVTESVIEFYSDVLSQFKFRT